MWRVRGLVTVFLLVVSTLVLGSVPAQAQAYDACPVAAHRGDHARWTENSLNAYRVAIADRANFLEMDVQVTSDGQFVLMHDQTVQRTTRGKVAWTIPTRTWAQVRRLRLTDGRRVPRLAAVLRVAEPSAAKVLVELKWIPRSRWPKLVAMLRGFGADRVVVNSFSPDVLLRFRADYPTMATALDLDRPVPLATARRYGAVMVDYRHLTGSWLRRMNRAQVPVYAWTVDSTALWKRYAGRIEVILTNRVPDYVAFREKYCASMT